MRTVIVIVLLVLGSSCALFMSRPLPLVRWLWPGPTVKGPGDSYLQAFQAILIMIVLGTVALVASVVSYLLSTSMGWSAGRWLSTVPLILGMIIVFMLWTTTSR